MLIKKNKKIQKRVRGAARGCIFSPTFSIFFLKSFIIIIIFNIKKQK
jgi:hypothetical protein